MMQNYREIKDRTTEKMTRMAGIGKKLYDSISIEFANQLKLVHDLMVTRLIHIRSVTGKLQNSFDDFEIKFVKEHAAR